MKCGLPAIYVNFFFFLQSIFQNESAIIVHSNSLLAIFGGFISSCPRLLSYSPAVSNACLKRYSSPNDSSIAPQSPRAPSTFMINLTHSLILAVNMGWFMSRPWLISSKKSWVYFFPIFY